jgi:penicillin-binding protein 1A
MTPNRSGPSAGLRIDPGDRPSILSASGEAIIRVPKLSFWPISLSGAIRSWRRGRAETESKGEDGGKSRVRKARKGGKRSGWSRWWVRLLGLGVAACVWLLIAGAGVVALYSYDLPDLSNLTATTRRPSVTLVSSEGETIAAYGDVFGEPVTLATVPKYLPQAIIATEDRHFYSHFGVDPLGMLRALFADVRAGHVVQGGSTITQQLAKNLFLTPERSLKRKVQELVLAVKLEHRFSKEQLLTLYLNRVYLGNGTWGVDAAARRYFGVPASRMTLYQSALIAGLLKAPSRYNPINDADLSRERTAQVLDNMETVGDITHAQAEAALAAGPASVRHDTLVGRYFADWVRDKIDQYNPGGADVVAHTTIDMRLQRKAEAFLEATLAGPAAKAGATQGAIVVMSPDGAVRAMVGGRSYADSQFNRATQGMRQPGSSFKPFLYLAALEAGWKPTDTISDTPITTGDYQPNDYEGTYEGTITLRRAFAKSSNVAAVRLIEKVGPARVAAVAHRLGIGETLHADASLALGTSETSLLAMTDAYASFANDGNGVFAYGVAAVDDRSGNALFRREGEGAGRVVARADLAAMDDLFTAVMFEGTGRKAILDRPAAGKTGTTQDYRDAWFIGFTADYVCGVWLGNDDNTPMKRVTGGTLPAALWRQVMLEANKGLPVKALPGAEYVAAGQTLSSDATAPGTAPGQAGGERRGGESPDTSGGAGGGAFDTFVHSLMKFLGG